MTAQTDIGKPVDKDKQMQVKVENLALAEVMFYSEDRLQPCEDEVAPLVKLLKVRKFIVTLKNI